MDFNPTIFRSHEIWGEYGKDFDAAFATRLGNRVASYLKAGTIIVACADSSGPALELKDGAVQAGAQVIDVGYVSGPQLAWTIRQFGARGAILSGAHIRVFGSDGHTLGGHHLRQIYDSHAPIFRADGSAVSRDIVPEYARAVADLAGWVGAPIPVTIDAPLSVRQVFECIGAIAPASELAVRFDHHGELAGVYRQGHIWHDWGSHITPGAVHMPELAVLELIQKTAS